VTVQTPLLGVTVCAAAGGAIPIARAARPVAKRRLFAKIHIARHSCPEDRTTGTPGYRFYRKPRWMGFKYTTSDGENFYDIYQNPVRIRHYFGVF